MPLSESNRAMTINEDGSPVLIEAVYWQHRTVYADQFETIEGAVSFLNYGEDDGTLSSVGVFVDGEPRVTDHYVHDPGRPPTAEEAEEMRKAYAEAQR